MITRPDTIPPALRDPKLDRKLRRDGFVSFPLLEPDEVAHLRDEFARLRGWEGEGFQADLQRPDPDYKREVGEVLAKALEQRVTERFTRHQPFLYNFLCKYPGPDSGLYVHRDWMYVDERIGHRTYVAWIALQDVRGDIGRLRVLRGSHRIEAGFRGTDLIAPWLEHADVIDERLRSLRVRAGDCVVIDNGLTHSSYPNLTDEPRLVAAVGMRPIDAPLVHFFRSDPTTTVRYDIDETFFVEHTPQGLLTAPPDLPIAETTPDNQERFTADELARALDRGVRSTTDRLARRAAGVPGATRERFRSFDLSTKLRGAVHFAPGGHRGPGTGPIRSVLVIATSPDERPSTEALREIVAELSERPGLVVHTWFMTALDRTTVWDGARVLDAPFTSNAVQAATRLSRSAGRRLRGLRRLLWLVQARPDLVIFDDGLGEPLIRRTSRDHVRVLRANPLRPEYVPGDLAAVVGDAHLAVASPNVPVPPGVPLVEAPEFFAPPPGSDESIHTARQAWREAAGLPDDALVVVGVGRHGWVDGPDLFLRTLWAMEHRHGVLAHGLWIWEHAAIDEATRLTLEAQRCGLTDRMHFASDPELRVVGDVALLPYRDTTPDAAALTYLASGVPVVSFPVWTFEHPLLFTVPHLDLDAAAHAVITARRDAPERLASWQSDHAEGLAAVPGWVDQFLAAAAKCRH